MPWADCSDDSKDRRKSPPFPEQKKQNREHLTRLPHELHQLVKTMLKAESHHAQEL